MLNEHGREDFSFVWKLQQEAICASVYLSTLSWRLQGEGGEGGGVRGGPSAEFRDRYS